MNKLKMVNINLGAWRGACAKLRFSFFSNSSTSQYEFYFKYSKFGLFIIRERILIEIFFS
uniref:Uncharacterized protein n=1 Tax=Meloidogyne enterolobii TaxID=390850 RepID=A0A6V7YC30_MELEN|nr:unnamed protein product [Meloidogyne enterolobii]